MEHFEILTTVEVVSNKFFNCEFCKKKYGQAYRDKKKACAIKSQKPIFETENGIKYYRCPANFANFSIMHFIDMVKHFRNGVMPFSGSMMEQPNKVIEVLNLIDRILIKNENEEIERNQRKWQTTK
jgi:hypothetical protein